MPLTETGYHRPTLDEILNSMMTNAKRFFGDDIDLSEQTALGKFIRITGYDLAQAYEDIEFVFFARFPNTATGQNLDRLCEFVGVDRAPATPAIHKIRVKGTAGYTVQAGIVVTTNNDIIFYSTAAATINENGICDIPVTCEIAGDIGNLQVGAITRLVNPDADIEGIEHIGIVALGTNEESDFDLRNRFIAALEGIGSASADAIRATVARIKTVEHANVIENNESTPDEKGREPHSFECYVYGGDAYHQEIAEAIFSKKPTAIKAISSYPKGDINRFDMQVTSSNGAVHDISFSRCETIIIKLKIGIVANIKYNETQAEEVKTKITDYINGQGVGKSVIITTLYGNIYGVDGIDEVKTVTIAASHDNGATFGEFTAENLPCEYWQVIKTIKDNVLIEVGK